MYAISSVLAITQCVWISIIYFFTALNHRIQVEVITAGPEELNPGAGWNTGLKRKTTKDTSITNSQLLTVPGLIPRRQSAAEMQADLEAKGSAVRDLFEGNYEERRKFGVVDIFDTLGFAVSNQY